MKVGDLVKFRGRTVGEDGSAGATGLVTAISAADKVFENRTADVWWNCEYQHRGPHRFATLEVVNESR